MSYSLEIKLKEPKEPSMWRRFVQWLEGEESLASQLGQQVPKTGTNTEILLSQTQALQLKDAVASPGERTSDTSFVRRDSSPENLQLII